MSLLADANGLVEAMKRAARDERESSKPVNVYFGEVVSVAPLKINVEQKMVLGESQLILTRNVTDYMTTVTVQWNTEIGVLSSDGKTTAPPPHLHGIVGQKNFLMHNALEVGDEVILIRQQEGQKFIVIDRIGGK
ncbi:DUF2577 domain-containing protein [Otoolea muris]|uniref:DUF2577 domain-containing protein n=1 Tax=Otoolea muris TaxID=2941515 RepID=UPI00203BB516|nr:DUF2577 domain-containing protein [Otoolea muris]